MTNTELRKKLGYRPHKVDSLEEVWRESTERNFKTDDLIGFFLVVLIIGLCAVLLSII